MTWQTGSQRVKVWMAGKAQTQVFAAKGLGWLPTETIDCTIVRRSAQSTTFAAVYQALLPTDQEKPITRLEDAGAVKVGDIEVNWSDFTAPITVKTADWQTVVQG